MAIDIKQHTIDFGTTGQITSDDLGEIVRLGYKSLINNRPDGEGGDAQPLQSSIKQQALDLGLNYAYLPVISGQLTEEQIQKMANLLDTLPKPILAFCRSGARSTNLYVLSQQI